MNNERLRKAMFKAGYDVDSLSRATMTTPKTVQRWIQGTSTPKSKMQWSVANLLKSEPSYLWPQQNEIHGTQEVTQEIVNAYPHRTDAPIELWHTLLANAHRKIDLLGYAMLFLPEQNSAFTSTLLTKAEKHCEIRIALADPACQYVAQRDKEEHLHGTLEGRIRTTIRHFKPLLTNEHIAIHSYSAPLYNSVFRFDDDLIVTPHLYGTPGYEAPLLHLRKIGSNGIFERFIDHFEKLWEVSTPINNEHNHDTN